MRWPEKAILETRDRMMGELKSQVTKLRTDAARCERLCAGTYNPTLSAQLLTYASEFRHRAAQLERISRAA